MPKTASTQNVQYIAWLYFALHARCRDMNLRFRVALIIQDLRRARGLSQEEFAQRAGVNRGYMGKLENAKYAASLDMPEKVAKGFRRKFL